MYKSIYTRDSANFSLTFSSVRCYSLLKIPPANISLLVLRLFRKVVVRVGGVSIVFSLRVRQAGFYTDIVKGFCCVKFSGKAERIMCVLRKGGLLLVCLPASVPACLPACLWFRESSCQVFFIRCRKFMALTDFTWKLLSSFTQSKQTCWRRGRHIITVAKHGTGDADNCWLVEWWAGSQQWEEIEIVTFTSGIFQGYRKMFVVLTLHKYSGVS